MSDTDLPLHDYLKEVLGYLNILGKNLQKRTQNLSDNKINEKYLSSEENVNKTANKINSICALSKASIDKVQAGVKSAINSYLKKTFSHQDGLQTQPSNLTEEITESNNLHTPALDSPKKADSNGLKRKKVPHSKKKSNRTAEDSEHRKPEPHEDSIKEDTKDSSKCSQPNKQEKQSVEEAKCDIPHSDTDSTPEKTSLHEYLENTETKTLQHDEHTRDTSEGNFKKIEFQNKSILIPENIELEKYSKNTVSITALSPEVFDKCRVIDADSIICNKDSTEKENSQTRKSKKKKPHSKPKIRSSSESDTNGETQKRKSRKNNSIRSERCSLSSNGTAKGADKESQRSGPAEKKFKRIIQQDSDSDDCFKIKLSRLEDDTIENIKISEDNVEIAVSRITQSDDLEDKELVIHSSGVGTQITKARSKKLEDSAEDCNPNSPSKAEGKTSASCSESSSSQAESRLEPAGSDAESNLGQQEGSHHSDEPDAELDKTINAASSITHKNKPTVDKHTSIKKTRSNAKKKKSSASKSDSDAESGDESKKDTAEDIISEKNDCEEKTLDKTINAASSITPKNKATVDKHTSIKKTRSNAKKKESGASKSDSDEESGEESKKDAAEDITSEKNNCEEKSAEGSTETSPVDEGEFKENKTDEEKTESLDSDHKPKIRCVNIANLLASPAPNLSPSVVSKSRKVVTFQEPVEIFSSPEKPSPKLTTPLRTRPSMLKNRGGKSSPVVCNKSSSETKDLPSSDSESDGANATRELLNCIKNDILEGRCKAYVDIVRDPLHTWPYLEKLTLSGINRVYNELGVLCSKESKIKEKELNDNAKLAVLNSSSSSDVGDLARTRTTQNVSLGSSSLSEATTHSTDRVKKKKYSKKRQKRSDVSDSEAEIESLLSLAKRRREKARRSSRESPDVAAGGKSAEDKSADSEEMGRSLRLKGRTEQSASPQQNKKDRNEPDSSSAAIDKSGGDNSMKKSKENNLLLETLINGDKKSEGKSSTEQSSESGSDSKKVKSKVTPSGKPMDRIKNDLLDDETSSSAQEQNPPKLNGKKKPAKSGPVQDSDEEPVVKEEEEDDSHSDSGTKNRSNAGSVIELDSGSEDDSDVEINKKKKKKSKVNGKSDNESDNEAEKDLGSDTDESEIFVSTRRKRKPKPKSSDDSDDDEKESGKSNSKRRRIKKSSGGDSSGDDGSGSDGDNNKKLGRKNIRALKKSINLDSATRTAARKERERVARMAERQKLYNESLFDESGKPDEVVKLEKVVLDFDPETKEPTISVDKGLVEKLKPHQANGIKFMWDACFESEKQIRENKGSGCILAHCMGLGKTLQVVTLVHTLLTHRKQTKVERVLVVCPLSTVLNWVNEFRMWLEYAESEEEINIFELSRFKQNYERSYQLKEWLECGGVCILGYDMFRNLSAENSKKFKKAQLSTFQKALVDPGPDLVVCDEGHLLKNEKTSISQSMNRVKSLRRIVLTGTPLQNNLKEYYCMVQFVKPDLLGKYNDYLNRFVNPITNGQYTNSTEHDIRVMKRRSHVLHKMLDMSVQRRDYAVLAPFLPPKHEYVLFISLTDIQVKLYAHYLENYSKRPNPDRKTTPSLFADFQALQRIWTHPLVLKANSERYELMQQKKRDKEEEEESEASLADFIDDDDEEETTTPQESSVSDSEESDASDNNRKSKNKKKGKHSKVKHKRLTRANAVKPEEDDEEVLEMEPEAPRSDNPTEWWMSLCPEDQLGDVRHSNKLLLLLDILKMCEAIGDKLLVFSQSLYSLDLIEQFLSKIDDATQKNDSDEHLGGHVGSWSPGLDYFRLDGSTSCENREIWCKSFNREDNPRARLFLISTRAGGLGINLVAANRVVIFDMSWNPSHDVQSIFRVYRFGQKKPCYIYRFLALGTMEEKIYERQVTKQAISKRVIDEQQIDRHYTESDLAELYIFCPVPEGTREVPKLPKDRLFADLLQQHDKVIYKFHEHDSLLENKEEETLTEEERKAAWEDYENEKTRPPPALGGSNWLQGLQQQHQQQQMAMNALSAVLRQDYPSLTEQQIATMIPTILQQMYTSGDAQLMQKMTAMMSAQNMMTGYKYPQNPMMPQGMMGLNPVSAGTMGVGMRGAPVYQQSWQQQQQMQLQRLQQQQAANLKYYAGGLGSRDMLDMAALQQQQRALLLGAQGSLPQRGRPPKGPPRQTNEVVDLDSE